MPTTTTGKATDLITFSRGTLATVTDADGKIKWAPHNLLLASEQFDSSSWTKTGVTVTANASAAPNGTTTADRLAGSTSTKDVYQTVSLVLGVKYKIAVWAKSFGGTNQTIAFFGDNNIVSGNQTVTADWQLFEFEFTVATGGSRVCGITQGSGAAAYDILAWGASLTRADLGGMQSNASAYPYYNPSTKPNLLGYSEDWSNAAWTKSSVSVTANAIAAPNGSLTADLLKEDVGSAWHSAYQGATTAASGTYTLSVYLKSGGRQYANLSIGSGTATSAWASITADLTGGTITSNQAGATGTYVSSAITSVGDGWYRVSMVGKIGSNTDATFSVALSDVASPSRGNYAVYSYNGNGTSGIYLWGAQLSDSASLDPYVPNFGPAPSAAAAHGPRLDYSSSGSALGLLVEETRTNLVTQSNVFNVAAWTKGSGGTASVPVITPADAIAPDGTLTAQKVVFDRGAGNTISDNSVITSSIIGFASSTTYTGSVYVKAATAGDIGKQLGWRHVGGGSYGVITLAAAWQRVTRTETSFSTSSSIEFVSRGTVTTDNSVGVHIWGVSVEVGASNAATAFATSLIVTSGATVTRNADVASVGVSQFPYSTSEGTIVVNAMTVSPTASNNLYSLDDGLAADRIYAVQTSSTVNSLMSAASSTVFNQFVGTATANTAFKSGLAYALNNANMATNGTLATLDTTVALPARASVLRIGANVVNTAMPAGWIRQITYLPRRISDTELAARAA